MSDNQYIFADPGLQQRLRAPQGLPPSRQTMDGFSRVKSRRLNPEIRVKTAAEFSTPAVATQPVRPNVAKPINDFTARRLAPTQLKAQPAKSVVLRRQAVRPPTQRQANVDVRVPARVRHSKGQIVLTTMAILIFSVGVWVSLTTWRTNHTVKDKVSALAQQAAASSDGTLSGDQVPDESLPKGPITDYHVAPDLPRFISIPRFGTKARVVRVGVTADNELKTPASVYDTGWYDNSAKPDQDGAVVIDGHVSGPTKAGVFYNLKKLVPGDIINIEKGDGKLLTYKVVQTKTYPKDSVDMTAALTPITTGKKGLNLITCDGKPVPGKNFTFDHRLVVFAEQVD